jgi:hypothetical protein
MALNIRLIRHRYKAAAARVPSTMQSSQNQSAWYHAGATLKFTASPSVFQTPSLLHAMTRNR